MSLTFFAHNRGKQTDLILRLIDWNDKSKEATIYLDSTGMKKLLALVGMIDESFVEARETVKKRELFK